MPIIRNVHKKRRKKKRKRRKYLADDEFFPSMKTYIDLTPCGEENLANIQEQLDQGLVWPDERAQITNQDWSDPNWHSMVDMLRPDGRLIMALLVMSLEAQLPEEFFSLLMSSQKVKSVIKSQGITESSSLIQDLC